MNEWLLLWGAPALALFGLEIWQDVRARRQPVVAAFCAAIWPIYLPIGIWVALNPKKADRIRRRFGTGR